MTTHSDHLPRLPVAAPEVLTAVASAIGPRERLEDAAFAATFWGTGALGMPRCTLLGVFDGVGGASGGAVASRNAARANLAYSSSWFAERWGEALRVDQIGAAIGEAIREASDTVSVHASVNPSDAGAATTAVVAIVHDGRLVFGWAGDSRAYLIRRGDCERLTTDHTNAQLLFEQGIIRRSERESHPESHILARWLGGDHAPQVSLGDRRVMPGDTVVLTTDGVHGVLSEGAIASIVTGASSVQEASDRLIEEALHHGTTDNATAVCGQIGTDRSAWVAAAGLRAASNRHGGAS